MRHQLLNKLQEISLKNDEGEDDDIPIGVPLDLSHKEVERGHEVDRGAG